MDGIMTPLYTSFVQGSVWPEWHNPQDLQQNPKDPDPRTMVSPQKFLSGSCLALFTKGKVLRF